MRKVVPKRELAHLWANQTQSEARSGAYGTGISFEGRTLYSYREPIAELFEDGTVMHTTQSWSVTTSDHQRRAKEATNHKLSVTCRRVQDTPLQNCDYVSGRIAELMAQAERALTDVKKDGTPKQIALKRCEESKATALGLAEQFNAYLAACHRNQIGLDVAPIDTANLEHIRDEMKRREEKQRLARAVEQERRREAAKEDLEKWRAGETVNRSMYDLPVALRLAESRGSYHTGGLLPDAGSEGKPVVQTSHGAEIPVSAAKRLWPALLAARESGVAQTQLSIKLGHYTLNEIRIDGSIRVGCHDIAFSELEAMALQLGLIEKETA